MGSIWYFSNHSIYDGIYDELPSRSHVIGLTIFFLGDTREWQNHFGGSQERRQREQDTMLKWCRP